MRVCVCASHIHVLYVCCVCMYCMCYVCVHVFIRCTCMLHCYIVLCARVCACIALLSHVCHVSWAHACVHALHVCVTCVLCVAGTQACIVACSCYMGRVYIRCAHAHVCAHWQLWPCVSVCTRVHECACAPVYLGYIYGTVPPLWSHMKPRDDPKSPIRPPCALP